MKNTFVKVLSFMMALTMIVGAFGAITVSAAECAHENRTETAVVAPTCATAGFTSYKCNDCGESFIDGIKNATGKHTWTNVAASAATCEDPAYSAHKKCSVCEAVEGKTATGAALGHAFNIPYVQKATCTEDGFTSKKCARCGKVDDRIAPAGETPSDEFGWKVVSADDKAAHKYIYTVVTAPTACTSGSIKVTCSACDYNATIAQTEDHNWKDMSSSDAAAMLTKKNIVVGDNCNATYKSGKICIDCGAVKDTVAASKTHSLKEVSFAIVGDQELNAEIQALGYNYGDKTSTEVATQCVTVRVYLAQCELCKVYAKASAVLDEGKGHKWVKDGAEYYADGTPSHKEDKLQNYKCDNVLEDGTTKCSATKTEVAKPATACTYKKEGAIKVTAATCETNGYTEYKCDECGVVTKGDITYKTGHNYSAAQYKSGICDDGTAVYVKKCPNKGCENPEIPATAPEGADACKWVKVTRKATCIADAYYEYECSVCKDTKAYDKTDKPAAGFDKTNHVVTTADTPVEENVVKATCTNKAQNRYLCSCGTLVDLEVGATPAHTKGTVYHVSACGKAANAAIDASCKADCKSVAVKDATCKATGYSKAGEICTVCGVIITAPTVSAINPKAHIATPVFVESGEATCVAKKYTTSYYSCCGLVDKIEEGDVVETAHGAKLKTVAAVAATCTSKGVAAHQKCEACGLLWKADQTTLTKANAITLASLATATADGDLVHDWNTTAVAKVPETCTATGTKAYYTCKDCTTHIKVDGQIVCDDPATTDKNERAEALKIAAHGTQYMGWQKGQAPTCTADGYRFKGVDDATKYYTETIYCCAQCDKIPVAKTGHTDVVITNYNPVGSNYNCTLESYKVVECSVCKATYFKDYAAAAKKAHEYTKYTDGDKKGQDKADVVGAPTCTTAAVDQYYCVNCEYVDERPGAAATGHAISVNGVSIKVNFGCASEDHKTYKGFKCACGAELGKDSEHNIVTATAKAPTCTTTGNYAFDFCVDCGKVINGSVVEIPATGHNVDSVLIEVVDGVAKYSCPDCGEFWTEPVIDNVSVEAEFSSTLVTAGSTFTVEIFATADNFAFNEFEIDCSAWDSAFELVKVELTDALPATAHADFDSDGYFWIYSEHDAEGKPGFITLNGEKVNIATLTFKVADVAEPDEYTFEVGPYDAVVGFDEDGYPIESEIIADYVEYDVTVALAGDLNGDFMIGTSDVQQVMYIVSTGANDLVADVNRDGVVDVFDIAALRKFTSSGRSGYDYLVMTGVNVEAVAAKYKADMNEDGYINDSDSVLFVEFMVDALQDMSYTDFLAGMASEEYANLDELCAEIARMIALHGVPTI